MITANAAGRTYGLLLGLIAVLTLVPAMANGQDSEPTDPPQGFAWTGRTITDDKVSVPAPNQPSLLLFVMGGQDRSVRLLKQVAEHFADRQVQLVAVVSGNDAADKAGQLARKADWTNTMVADPKYELSGDLAVRVWPTSVVIGSGGRQVAHVGGMPASLLDDLTDYVAFADQRINRDTLEQRLARHDVIESTPTHAASRHLEVAHRLVNRRQFDQARREYERGLALNPDDPRLALGLARVDVLTGDPASAIKRLDSLEDQPIISRQLRTTRGWALLEMGEWAAAKQVLTQAVRLNPDPAEAWYLLGRCHEHDGDWQPAAQAYRNAFEHTPAGTALMPVRQADQ